MRPSLVSHRETARVVLAVLSFAIAAGFAPACREAPKADPCGARLWTDIPAIETVPIAQRSAVTAAALVETCNNDPARPMPKGLREALSHHSFSGGHGGIASIGQGIADLLLTEPDLWSTMCGKSAAAVARALQTVAANGGEGFLETCPIGALGFARNDELAPTRAANQMLAGLSYAWLVREGMNTFEARRLARALAGL